MSRKLKATLITAGCSVFLLLVYRSIEQKSGNKAKSWIYHRLATDGSFDKDKMVTWLVQSEFAVNAKEAERAIREVIEKISPESRKSNSKKP